MFDCEGNIHFKRGEVAQAIEKFEASVGGYPYSRSYLNLAVAYEQRAREDAASREDDVRAARRFLTHAVNLGPTSSPTPEVEATMERLEALSAG